MKILFCNKYFYPKGGAEISMFETARLLESYGHQVAFFSMHHPLNYPSVFSPFFVSQTDYGDAELNFFQKAKIAGRLVYSSEARNKIRALIKQEKPDIVHLNNIYHQLSPSIIDELYYLNVPMVMTMRDFKMVCPSYLCFRQNEECDLCSQGKYYYCFLHRCTKGSYSKSFLNMVEMYLHHHVKKIYYKVNAFISPSMYLKTKVEKMGFNKPVVHLPNFVRAKDFTPNFEAKEKSLVYFGRLSQEKGLARLLEAVKNIDVILKIIGDGPQREELERKAKDGGLCDVRFLGYRQEEGLHEEIRKSLFVVLPSEWPENYPRSVIEAFALGKPVIGARIGGIPELVKDYVTGLTFVPGNIRQLRELICYLINHPDTVREMGERARQFVETELSPEKHYSRLREIYEQAMAAKRKA